MRKNALRVLLFFAALVCLGTRPAVAQDFHFDGSISRRVLDNYLSRAITCAEILHDDLSQPRDKRGLDPRDNIRMILNIKAKFIGRSIMLWDNEKNLSMNLKNARVMAEVIHNADPDIILQAGEFETVSPQVETITVPKSVLAAFGQPVVDRTFRYDQIIYPDGQGPPRKHVPDMSQVETRMWFYFLATQYIDVGIEAIHFGQIGLMDKNDPGHVNWIDMLTRVRSYAHQHARRHFVLCDAHTPKGGVVENGKTLLDFDSMPLRISEVDGHPYQGVLKMGYADAIFGKSLGAVTPTGWSADHLPYLVEFDNYGDAVHATGQPSKYPFIWGWDEITWFALLPEQERDAWLRYAWNFVRQSDPNGHLEMPGSRVLAPGEGVSGPGWFWANTRSPACPGGFNTEATIKDIWQNNPLPGS